MKAKVFTSLTLAGGALFLWVWLGLNLPVVDNVPVLGGVAVVFFMVSGFVGLGFATYQLIKWFW